MRMLESSLFTTPNLLSEQMISQSRQPEHLSGSWTTWPMAMGMLSKTLSVPSSARALRVSAAAIPAATAAPAPAAAPAKNLRLDRPSRSVVRSETNMYAPSIVRCFFRGSFLALTEHAP